MYEKSKIKNFSSFYHLFNFIIFFFLIAIIGYLLDFLILGLIIFIVFIEKAQRRIIEETDTGTARDLLSNLRGVRA